MRSYVLLSTSIFSVFASYIIVCRTRLYVLLYVPGRGVRVRPRPVTFGGVSVSAVAGNRKNARVLEFVGGNVARQCYPAWSKPHRDGGESCYTAVVSSVVASLIFRQWTRNFFCIDCAPAYTVSENPSVRELIFTSSCPIGNLFTVIIIFNFVRAKHYIL